MTYLDMEIEAARAAKWLAGKAKYGPVFKTNPIEELDQELLDAMNYVEEAERWGYNMGNLRARFHALCVEIRYIHKTQDCLNPNTYIES